VVNRAIGHNLPEVLAGVDGLDLSPYRSTPVGWGGPVELTHGTVIARGSLRRHEGKSLGAGIVLTWSQDALTRLIDARAPILLCLGYAGWGPMQLDGEIEQGGWIWAEMRPEILFDVPMEERYERALATLGLSPRTVWMPPADA
jgi:putative transcriptional regulator